MEKKKKKKSKINEKMLEIYKKQHDKSLGKIVLKNESSNT